MEVYTIIFQVFNGIISVYTGYIFFDIFSKKREMPLKWLCLLGLSSAFVATLLFTGLGALRLTILFLIIVLTSFLFKMHWYIRLFLGVAVILLSSGVEQIVAIFGGMILDVNVDVIKTGYYFIIFGTLAKLLAFGIVAVIRLGKHAKVSGITAPVVYASVLPVASFMMILVLSDYINMINNRPGMKTFTIITLLLVCLTNVLAFYVVDRVYANLKAEQDLKIANQLIDNQRHQYQNLYESQQAIRKVKHDLKNVLLGMLSQLKSGEVDEVIGQIQETSLKLSDTENVICGNQTIDTILNVKKQEAKEYGVTIDATVENIAPLQVDPVDFSVMFGNALDNAIEATSEVTKQEKRINVGIIFKHSNLIVVVTNPVNEKIDVENMRTTKKDKSTHGFGVLQIKSLAADCGGQAIFECDDTTFKCTLFFEGKNG